MPAHAHDDPHGPTWFDDDSYHVWMDTEGDPPPHAKVSDAEKASLKSEGLIDPNDPNKLHWLFYTTQQVGDFFASDDVDGNTVDPLGLAIQDDVYKKMVNDPALSRLRNKNALFDNDGCLFPRSPICGGANDDDGDLTTIRKYTYLRGIRAVAGLFKLFEQTARQQVTLTVVVNRVEQHQMHDYGCAPNPVPDPFDLLPDEICLELSDADFYARVTVAGRQSQNRGERRENQDDIDTNWPFGNSVPTSGSVPVKIEIRDEDGAYWDIASTGGGDDDSDIDANNGREDLDLDLTVDIAKCLRRQPGAIGGDLGGACGERLTEAGDSSKEASRVSFTIFTSGAPPTADAGGPYTTNEGTDVTLDGTGSSDPDNDITTYAWDFDNDGACDDATGAKPSFTAVGRDDTKPVKLCVTDALGLTDEDTTTVKIDNVAPSISVGSNAPTGENTTLTVTGTISDPGWLDPLSGTISWGDGSAVQALAGAEEHVRPDGTLAFTATHVYGDNGLFTAQICAADDDSNPCTSFPLQITNTPPTAVIDLSGAVDVNGTPTIIAHAGSSVGFSGRATDPGSDDLTLAWKWGDGTPDAAKIDLVNPPNADPPLSPSIQPRDLVYASLHAFGAACAYETTFAVGDDDGGSASQTAAVIVVGNGHPNQPHGYWKQQFRFYNSGKGNADFDAGRLGCYLKIVDYMSSVFHQQTDASTFLRSEDVLETNQTSVINELFDQQLLAVWLNFANGAVEWNRLVDTNGDKTPDTRFLDAITAAERLRLDPNTTRIQLDRQKTILESWAKLP